MVEVRNLADGQEKCFISISMYHLFVKQTNYIKLFTKLTMVLYVF